MASVFFVGKGAQSKPVLAAVLSAVLTLPSGAVLAAPSVETALQERLGYLCQRTEFTRSEIRSIQRSREFPVILTHTLDACPAVAAVLTSGATASTPRKNGPGRDDPKSRPSRGKETGKAGY